MTKPRYETTLGRAALALLAGAICGSLVIAILALAPRVMASPLGQSWLEAAALAVTYWSIWLALFASGLLVLALPVWWVLHRLGHRSPIKATILGLTLTLVSYLAYSEYSRRFRTELSYGPAPIVWSLRVGRPGYWPMMIEGAVWFSIAGSLAGLAIWRIAYRRPGSAGSRS